MKKKLLLLPVISLLVGCGDSPVVPPEQSLKEYIESLKDYNFTFSSLNASKRMRVLEVYSKDSFLLRRGTYSTSFRQLSNFGMFYIEDQGVQDYHLDASNDVVVDFIEGVGQINVPGSFAYDAGYHTDSAFSHLPVETVFDFDADKFTKDGKEYITHDRDIIEAISLLSNSYYSNWEDVSEGGKPTDYYLDFSKCTVVATLEGNTLTFELQEDYQDWLAQELDGRTYSSYFVISNVNNTHNDKIESYMANPTPLVKKTAYTTDLEGFQNAFGDATIPFLSDKYSNVLSITEDFETDYYMNIFDSNPGEGILEELLGLMDNDEYWVYDAFSSKQAKKQQYYSDADTYAYTRTVTIDEEEIHLQFVFTYVNKSLLDDIDKELRPNGFFYASLYRYELSDETIGYDNINAKFNKNGFNNMIPMFDNVETFDFILVNMSEYLDPEDTGNITDFYILYIYEFSIQEIDEFIANWKAKVFATGKYVDNPEQEQLGEHDFYWYGTYGVLSNKKNITLIGTLNDEGTKKESYTVTYIIQKA